MPVLLTLVAGFVLVTVPALILLIRSARALSRARAVLAAAGIGVDESSDWHQAMKQGRRRGGWITLIVLGLILIGYLLTVLITHQMEPDAAGMLLSPAGLILAAPFLLVLGLLIPCWVLGAMVAAGHRLLTSPQWSAPEHADVPGSSDASGGSDASAVAVGHLRGVTWSQTGVTGIGVVAGVLSVIFGAALIAALFVVATTAITCARDPKCI